MTIDPGVDGSCRNGVADLQGLETRLQQRIGRRVQNLRLSVHDAGIVLRGRVGSYYAKQLAQHAVMLETDLPIFANEIEVI